MGKIVAIGGGEMGRPKEDGSGFYPVETTAIDQEIITLTNKKHPALLFLPTASGDSAGYAEVVQKHFTNLGCTTVDVLNLSDKALAHEQIRKIILSHDAIYVGGGNTLRMMTIWRRLGVDKMLKEAYEKGIVLSGISAGSICWFTSGSSDSRKLKSNNFVNVKGLGLIDALNCPHYDSEPTRQTDLRRMTRTTRKTAIALDNCAALEVVDNSYKIITSKPTAKARKVCWNHDQYVVEEIAVSEGYQPLDDIL